MNNEELADVLINSFIGIWPSIAGTMNPENLQLYKVQIIRGLMENGLNTPEAVSTGCKKARTEGGQYLPSVPEFVRWCKPERKHHVHYATALPSRAITKEDYDKYAQISKNILGLLK